jgi:hypothetical protein
MLFSCNIGAAATAAATATAAAAASAAASKDELLEPLCCLSLLAML